MRELKASKADKTLIKQQVEVLLKLKESLDKLKKSQSATSSTAVVKKEEGGSTLSADELNQQISTQVGRFK